MVVESKPTPLERALEGDRGASRSTPLDALRLARQRWLEGERLDMGALAQDLGISRATLYTWVGSKERLLGEVLWSFAEDGLAQATAAATGTGADYILDVFERFDRMNAGFPPLHRFLEQEPELALRLLTSKRGPVQGRMIAVAKRMLEEQVQAGALHPALDVDTLAYLIIRVAESFIYSDVITGSEPDVDKAVEVVRILLTAPPARPSAPATPRGRRASSRR
jgi:AcrR family transcriptional regulator